MNSFFKVGEFGTPLVIIKSSDYSIWHECQTDYVKKWLIATGYEGKGLALLPGEDADLMQAVFCVDDPYDYFACGDLATMLPAGDFRIEFDEQLKDKEQLLKVASFGWGIGAYTFDRYKKDDKTRACLVLPSEALFDEANIFIEAVTRVRDLVNTPAGDMMPEDLATDVLELADKFDAEVTQYIGDELLEQGYPTIHAVGRASVHAPRLIDLRWGNDTHPKITLVGKGVCFDSGGLDLKPAAFMRLMKKDMAGAAQAIGLAHLIMAHQLPVRLRLLVPAVENAVSGNAFRPGDIITTRKGLTVEIENTDAEGRLILCDALAEADSEEPELLIDFATLTGACRVALGTDIVALFSNDTTIAAEICKAGEKVKDPVWQLPLYQPYRELLDSNVADMINTVSSPYGGGITAGLYLQEFVSNETPWLHFDLMGWNMKKLPGRAVGGEAQAIRAVFNYLQHRYPAT